jgi:hypothetical protein
MEFSAAIAITENLLKQIDSSLLSEEQIFTAIHDLAQTINGARGFFVTYLTTDFNIADHPTKEVINGLKSSPEIVSDLLVKNLAMSSAMILTHERNHNLEMAKSSQQVRTRTINLINLLQIPEIFDLRQQILHSIHTGKGEYQEFLERWGYDHQQKQLMITALNEINVTI